MGGLAKCHIWRLAALFSHASWLLSTLQHTGCTKSIWLLLQHNLFFSTSANVTSSASIRKKFLNEQNGSRIFHRDFKLFTFLIKLKWVLFFPMKFYRETFFSEDVKIIILFFLLTQKHCSLQNYCRKWMTSLFPTRVSSVKHYHLAPF